MNTRQRLLATLNFEPCDHPPYWEWAYWPETLDRWYNEGLERQVGYPASMLKSEPLNGGAGGWRPPMPREGDAKRVPEEEIKQAELDFNPDFNEDSFFEDKSETILSSVKTKVTLQEFMYEKCTLEIFGYANEFISSAVETLNNLILENPQHEFIIITREGGLAIPSTLFFLSKTRCTCPNIKFVTEYNEVWDYVDVMITDHPEILNSKPVEKISVVVDKEYNQKITQSGLRIKTIKEVDSSVLQNIDDILHPNDRLIRKKHTRVVLLTETRRSWTTMLLI